MNVIFIALSRHYYKVWIVVVLLTPVAPTIAAAIVIDSFGPGDTYDTTAGLLIGDITGPTPKSTSVNSEWAKEEKVSGTDNRYSVPDTFFYSNSRLRPMVCAATQFARIFGTKDSRATARDQFASFRSAVIRRSISGKSHIMSSAKLRCAGPNRCFARRNNASAPPACITRSPMYKNRISPEKQRRLNCFRCHLSLHT